MMASKSTDKPLPKWWVVIFWFDQLVLLIGYFSCHVPSNSVSPLSKSMVKMCRLVPLVTNYLKELEANNRIFTDNFEQSILANAGVIEAMPSPPWLSYNHHAT
jgi:cytochrome c oxidase cbb3-type subunit 3